jgi:hypothetical protein
MTDPTGLSFLSYKRSRKHEAELLIAAQHDVGIPTWRDLDNLEEEPLETRLGEVLASPATANALLWITPEVKDAPVIRQIEVPQILRRKEKDRLFFVVPVAAGGLDYEAAGKAVRDHRYTLQNLSNWNLRKVERDPIAPADAAQVAGWVLERRIEALHRTLPAGEPLRLSLHTRERPPQGTGTALRLDWSHRFAGFENKEARPGAWEDFLGPALRKVAGVVAQEAPGRSLVAQGLASLPAAFGLGWAFMVPRGIPVTWQQLHPEDGSREDWSLGAAEKPSGFEAHPPDPGEISGKGLAVLVNVRGDAEVALRMSHPAPRFRAILRIGKEGESVHQLSGPGEAKHLAKLVVQSIREARERYPEIDCTHLFLSGPLGLSMMIGQLSNTLGALQTYDHVGPRVAGQYKPALRVTA